MGRRQESRPMLGRIIVQIRALCALACSWISTQTPSIHPALTYRVTAYTLVFMVAMATQNGMACEAWSWASDATCGLFTTVHVLSWFLIFICKSQQHFLVETCGPTHAFSVRGGICDL